MSTMLYIKKILTHLTHPAGGTTQTGLARNSIFLLGSGRQFWTQGKCGVSFRAISNSTSLDGSKSVMPSLTTTNNDENPKTGRTEKSQIAHYFKNRGVLITGGSGFIGRAILQKLLVSCEPEKIFLILRPSKAHKDVAQRLQRLLNSSPIFAECVQRPDIIKKIVPLRGDVSVPYLGLSELDRNVLRKECSVIIHSAASTRYTEPLHRAINLNCGGPARILDLFRCLENPSSLVHLSTAYTYSEIGSPDKIEEKIYPLTEGEADMDVAALIKLAPFLNKKNMLEPHVKELVGPKMNAYLYTKSIAERYLQVERDGMNVCILRPSIVTGAVREPFMGWDESSTGTGRGIAVYGRGLLGPAFADPKILHDLLPIDFLVNAILTAAWDLGTTPAKKIVASTAPGKFDKSAKPLEDIKVYNCVSGPFNPFTMEMMSRYLNEAYPKTPYDDIFKWPQFTMTKSKSWSNLNHFVTRFLPACWYDLGRICQGKKTRWVKEVTIGLVFMRAVSRFQNDPMEFEAGNLRALRDKQNAADRQVFGFQFEDIRWREYMHNYVYGIRKYVLKQGDEGLDDARRALRQRFSK